MNLVEKLTEEYVSNKARVIDNHLLNFLRLEGIADNGTVEEIKQHLKDAGLELITNIYRTLTQEVYTFKLCKVYKQTSLTIPNPTFSTPLSSSEGLSKE